MRVCQPTEEGRHLTVCVRPDGEVPVVGQDAVEDRTRIGCRWCASIMTRWNASKSASSPKRCSLPTARFSTWYTCPPGAFRAALGMGNEDTNGAVAAVNTSCVPVSVPRQSPSRMTRWTGYSRVCRPSAWRSSTIRKTGLRAVGRRGGAENERGRSWGVMPTTGRYRSASCGGSVARRGRAKEPVEVVGRGLGAGGWFRALGLADRVPQVRAHDVDRLAGAVDPA